MSSYTAYPIQGIAEPVSCISHFTGAVIFLCLAFFLVPRAKGHRGHVCALSLFAGSAVALLAISATYHLLHEGSAREVLQRIDHAFIFVLIAATFTPLHLMLFEGFLRWGMITLVWASAIVGIVLSTVFFRVLPEVVTLSFYLGLGWLGTISGYALWRRHGYAFVRPLFWGALAYTFGAVLDFAKAPVVIPGVIGPHEIFHFAVLTGIGFHWAFIQSFSGRQSIGMAPAPSAPNSIRFTN